MNIHFDNRLQLRSKHTLTKFNFYCLFQIINKPIYKHSHIFDLVNFRPDDIHKNLLQQIHTNKTIISLIPTTKLPSQNIMLHT